MNRRNFLKLPAVVALATSAVVLANNKKVAARGVPYLDPAIKQLERYKEAEFLAAYQDAMVRQIADAIDVGQVDSIEYRSPENVTEIGFSIELKIGTKIKKELLGPLFEACGFKKDNPNQYSPSSTKMKPVNIFYKDLYGKKGLLKEAMGSFSINYHAGSPIREFNSTREWSKAVLFGEVGEGMLLQVMEFTMTGHSTFRV